MGKYKVEILLAAWQDIDRISDVYLRLAGAASAKKITDALLDTLARLGTSLYGRPAPRPGAGPAGQFARSCAATCSVSTRSTAKASSSIAWSTAGPTIPSC